MRVCRVGACALYVVCALLVGARAAEPVPVRTVEIADGLYMLIGRGGNVALSVGTDGAFLVDDQYPEQHPMIAAALDALDARPLRFVINTHWHNDHSGSNAAFAADGATIIAHDNVRLRLGSDQVFALFDMTSEAPPPAALPVLTFTQDVTLHAHDDTVHVFHVEHAHTDGDAIVHFRTRDVIHAGDVFFNGRYPFIDSGNGGSLAGMIAAVDHLLALAGPATRIIPGHGELSDRDGLAAYGNMLRAAERGIAALIVAGHDVERVVLARPMQAYDADWGNGFIDTDTFVRMVFEDIKRRILP